MTIAPADYFMELYHCVRALSDWYNQEMAELENQRREAGADERQQIQQRIDDVHRQLVQRLKDGATTASQILASGVVNAVTVWFLADLPRKKEARDAYQGIVREVSSVGLQLPLELKSKLEPRFTTLPDPSWLALEIDFVLQTPWYSKDDRSFHVLDNPVRKDRVFGVPYMSAASWKGLLRWACRMKGGGQDPPWILHLFGNEKGEEEAFQRGALAFYPTWFSKIDFEVINPHSRKTRAGTLPIYYEVVPTGTYGMLRLLYAPLPGAAARNKVKPEEAIEHLLDAIQELLKTYGISAKRTVGWGTAEITQWRAYKKDCTEIREDSLDKFKKLVRSWLSSKGGRP
ncbi:MAG: RAMP superfamily CRISPR-associated protein [Syntrophothermus sp.]